MCSSRVILCAFSIAFVACRAVYAADGSREIDQCIAGNAVDVACMKKHQTHLESYVISGVRFSSWRLQRHVAEELVKYYAKTGQLSEPKAQIVIQKLEAYKRAQELRLGIFKSHYFSCTVGPGCEDGYSLDVGRETLASEEDLTVKQWFLSLDPKLYRNEIKNIELDVKLRTR